MSMIACSQDCCHQEEGYCALDNIIQLSGSTAAKCGYYKSRGHSAPEPQSQGFSFSPEHPEGIG